MNKRYKVKYEIVNTIAEKHNIVSCKQYFAGIHVSGLCFGGL